MKKWTIDAAIEEVFCELIEDQCYVSTNDKGRGTVESHHHWEVFDHHEIARVEIPHTGEEDEVRDEVLIPAITAYLVNFNFLGAEDKVEFTGDCLSYVVSSADTYEPLYRIILG